MDRKAEGFAGNPADIEAERSLLGSILQDPEVMGTATMTISPDIIGADVHLMAILTKSFYLSLYLLGDVTGLIKSIICQK